MSEIHVSVQTPLSLPLNKKNFFFLTNDRSERMAFWNSWIPGRMYVLFLIECPHYAEMNSSQNISFLDI